MRWVLLALLGVLPGASAFSPAARAADAAFTPAQLAFYEKDVLPVLKANCLKCHGDDPKKLRGGLALTSRAALVKGGDTGPAFEAGKVEESLLVKAVRYKNEEAGYNMPPAGKLPDAQVEVIAKWVAMGLPFPVTPTGGDAAATHEEKPRGADKNYWAYKPVVKPAPPAVKNAGWVRTPIDAFVLSRLEARGIAPVAPAEPRALIRRMTYDLTGLPPTPAEVEAFEAAAAKDRAGATTELIEKLLASPAYGEKWGRHWLDVVRYAETNGYERDGAKPFAWRYRDYVIKSLNADKPYDRFLKEQLAGDEMPRGDKGDNPDPVVATGFYRLGVWDDEPADPQLAMYDGLDDLVTTVGQGMLGMSLNCARCHDHKGDFFPQEDYYKLVAFFRDIRPDSRDGASPNVVTDISPREKRQVYEAALAQREAKMATLRGTMKPIEDAAIKRMEPKDQLAVEDGHRDQIVRKVPAFLEGEAKAAYLKLRAELDALKKLPMPARDLALSVNNCDPRPPVTNLLVRGNPGSKGKPVTPGFPEVFGLPDPAVKPADGKAGRRTALAEWVASPSNPMTARVMMNRVWHNHFGKGIVPTPNDFGKFGEKPTNPELLDYLAAEFVERGWSLKAMHRLILQSSVYQLASSASADGLKLDPANTLRWRFDMRRLGSEELRDTILTVSGKLDRTMGGPSVYPKIPAAVLAGQSVPGQGWHFDKANPDAANRRSVYVHVKRNLQVPILATHDQADPDTTCPVRYTTTVPTQALGLLNGEFANEQAATFAARLAKEAPDDLAKQVSAALRLTTGRVPTAAEVARDADFVRALQKKHALDDTTALTRYALLLLNTNEFAYLD